MLYHPNELLYINSKMAYEKMFDYFGLDSDNKDSIMLNIEMQELLKKIGVKIDLTETSMKLWNFYQAYIVSPNGNGPPPEKFDHIFIEKNYIEKIIRVLKRKKEIILKGVPSVGKTFIIRDLIRPSFENIGENGIEMIQFHQSYA